MKDKLIKLLYDARKNHNISAGKLCVGICSESMYEKIESGKKSIDRESLKRLLARLGIDSADYEHYLEYPDYDAWRLKMRIINLIEDEKLEEARELIDAYAIDEPTRYNRSRVNIEKQFLIFMKLQLMRHTNALQYKKEAAVLYEEALKLTVPHIDKVRLGDIMLSPIEFNLTLEYISRRQGEQDLDRVLDTYRNLLHYLDTSSYGKFSKAKIYSKTVFFMCRQIQIIIEHNVRLKNRQLYEELLGYCNDALGQLCQRKHMYYLTEILEIRIELLEELMTLRKSASKVNECSELLSETKQQLKVLMEIYEEYEISSYMKDDAYLYRQSGIYCTADVVRLRRGMYGMSRKDICEGICSEVTLMREENRKTTMQKAIVTEIFDRLRLMTDYISTFVVTDSKEAIEIYEDIRFARNSGKYEEVEELLEKLKKLLPDHPINTQLLMRLECANKWRMGEITPMEYVDGMKEALKQTVDIDRLKELEGKYFLAIPELESFYAIASVLKDIGRCDEAHEHIKILWDYCKILECNQMIDGEIGVYELVMTYVVSLLGDMKRYEESNHITRDLIKLSLKLRRSCTLARNLYNLAWNGKELCNNRTQFKADIHRCVQLSRLSDDKNAELFFKSQL